MPGITPRFDPSDPVVIPSLYGFRAKVLTLSCCDWVTLAIILFNRPFKTGSNNLKENVMGKRSATQRKSPLARSEELSCPKSEFCSYQSPGQAAAI